MKKAKKWKYILVGVMLLIVIEVRLYFIHPFAPLIILVSLLIQVPIIWLLFKAKTGESYRERAEKRRRIFLQDKDAEKWLQEEQKESKSIGYDSWSIAGKSLCALNQAEILLLLSKPEQAMEQLAQVKAEKLAKEDQERFKEIEGQAKGTIAENSNL